MDEFYSLRHLDVLVAAGVCLSGKITVGTELLLGPNKGGSFDPVTVVGVHYKRVDVSEIYAGQQASFAF